jgi:hypothetical protein
LLLQTRSQRNALETADHVTHHDCELPTGLGQLQTSPLTLKEDKLERGLQLSDLPAVEALSYGLAWRSPRNSSSLNHQ